MSNTSLINSETQTPLNLAKKRRVQKSTPPLFARKRGVSKMRFFNNVKPSLIGLEPLFDTIRLVMQTGYVQNKTVPVNLLNVSMAENGKTQAMRLIQQLNEKGTYETGKISQSVVVTKIFPMIEQQHLKHLFIPDMLNCIQTDKATKMGFLNTIKSLMEEGIKNLDSFNVKTYKTYNPPLQCGIITAITKLEYEGFKTATDGKVRWRGGQKLAWIKMGLASRFLHFSYDYTVNRQNEIHDFIEKDVKPKNPKPPYEQIKTTMKTVTGTEELFRQLRPIARAIGTELWAHGFRAEEQLMTLAKASALLRGNDKVEQRDIDTIANLSNFWNLQYNQL